MLWESNKLEGSYRSNQISCECASECAKVLHKARFVLIYGSETKEGFRFGDVNVDKPKGLLNIRKIDRECQM